MVMSWVWTGMILLSLIASLILGNGPTLAAAVPKGAQAAPIFWGWEMRLPLWASRLQSGWQTARTPQQTSYAG